MFQLNFIVLPASCASLTPPRYNARLYISTYISVSDVSVWTNCGTVKSQKQRWYHNGKKCGSIMALTRRIRPLAFFTNTVVYEGCMVDRLYLAGSSSLALCKYLERLVDRAFWTHQRCVKRMGAVVNETANDMLRKVNTYIWVARDRWVAFSVLLGVCCIEATVQSWKIWSSLTHRARQVFVTLLRQQRSCCNTISYRKSYFSVGSLDSLKRWTHWKRGKANAFHLEHVKTLGRSPE